MAIGCSDDFLFLKDTSNIAAVDSMAYKSSGLKVVIKNCELTLNS
jgi:hypothetical protein